MAISQPDAGDFLDSPDHSLLHRIIAADVAANVQSIGVNADGSVFLKNGTNSTTAFQVQAADTSVAFNVDTITGNITAQGSYTGGKPHATRNYEEILLRDGDKPLVFCTNQAFTQDDSKGIWRFITDRNDYGSGFQLFDEDDDSLVLFINNKGSSESYFLPGDTGNGTFRLQSAGVNFKSSANSTTAFQVQNSAGAIATVTDTTNIRLGVGVQPVRKLHLYRSDATAESTIYLQQDSTGDSGIIMKAQDGFTTVGLDGSDGSVYKISGNEDHSANTWLELDRSGNITIAGDGIFNGTLSLKEQANANADVTAYGQIWVKTATPNELWFTDDAGTDHQIAYV